MITHRKIASFGAAATLSISLISATTIPAAFAADPAPATAAATGASTSHTYDDGATISFPDTWTKGQALTFTGTGFKAKDGSGSVLAIKINGGAVNGQPYLRVEADANGNVSGSIPWQDNLNAGESVVINVLTGSLNKEDHPRGGEAATVTVVNVPAPTQAPAPSTAEPTAETSSPAAPSTPVSQPSSSTAPTTPDNSIVAGAVSGIDSAAVTSASVSGVTSSKSTAASGASGDSAPATCEEAAAQGLHDIPVGSKNYAPRLDRDSDGIACEAETHSSGVIAGASNGSFWAGSSGSSSSDGYTSRVASNGSSYTSASNYSATRSNTLASTGASGSFAVAGVGLLALIAGAVSVMVVRRRKHA